MTSEVYYIIVKDDRHACEAAIMKVFEGCAHCHTAGGTIFTMGDLELNVFYITKISPGDPRDLIIVTDKWSLDMHSGEKVIHISDLCGKDIHHLLTLLRDRKDPYASLIGEGVQLQDPIDDIHARLEDVIHTDAIVEHLANASHHIDDTEEGLIVSTCIELLSTLTSEYNPDRLNVIISVSKMLDLLIHKHKQE